MEAEFAKVVMGEEMMEQADGTICTLPDADPFIDEVINLCNVLMVL